MLRWSLVILSVWPLLLPPGFCLCRLERFGPRTSDATAVPSEAPPEDSSPHRCCRHKAATSRGSEHNSRVTTARPSEPMPDAPHSPTCPAHPSWEAIRAAAHLKAAPVPDTFLVSLWLSSGLDCAAAPASASERVGPPDERSCAHVPIYLSCRDLLC